MMFKMVMLHWHFYEGSNKYHAEFAAEFGGDDIKSTLGSGDWFKLNKEQEKFYVERGVYPNVLSVQREVWFVGIVEQYTVVLNLRETEKIINPGLLFTLVIHLGH